MDRIDELRGFFPQLGFALYAMTPNDNVTFEVYDGEQVYSFVGKTAAEAIDAAFPPVVTSSVFD